VGDAWTIRGNPLIRGFPQSRFVPSGRTGAMIGGDRFFSINVTVAPTIWGYPLVPKQVVNDPGFDRALETGLSVAEGSLRNRILGDTKEFKVVASLVLELPPVVAQCKNELKKIPSPNPDAQIEAQLKRLFKPALSPDQKPSGAFDRVELLVKNITHSLDPENDEEPATKDIVTLAVGEIFAPGDPLPSRIEELNEELARLEELLGTSEAAPIASFRQRLEDRGKLIKEKFIALDPPEPMEPSAQAKAANQQAKKEMAYSRHVLDQI